MKKLALLLMLSTLMLSSITYAAKEDTGYNEFGYNYNARIFNGTMQQYWEARGMSAPDYDIGVELIMKWSKNFVIQGANKNSWITNHYTWYTDDYENDNTYYGYDDVNGGVGRYRVEEFLKIKSYDTVPENVDELTVIWGNFVIIMDQIKIYDTQTGELVDEFDVIEKAHPGLGNMKF